MEKVEWENLALKEICEKIPHIPDMPGCYLWLGEEKKVLYVGKSINLRSRIRQYLHSDDYKTRFLMQRVKEIEWVSTRNELEALLLENTLIKKHRPPYNIHLKDDKRYPYLCLTMGEMYPRLILTRRKFSASHLYFGPFSDVQAARKTLKLIHKIFPIRKRPLKLPLKTPAKPCLNYHLKRCWAPCTNTVDVEEYRQMVLQIKDFLEGKNQKIQEELKAKMSHYAKNLEFEKAARYRDILQDLQKLLQSQQVEIAQEEKDFDVIALVVLSRENLIQELNLSQNEIFLPEEITYFGQLTLLKVRSGKLISRQNFSFYESVVEETNVEEVFLNSFFRDYYLNFPEIPPEIYINFPLAEKEMWEKILSDKKLEKVIIKDTKEELSLKKELLELALTNAKLSLRERVLNERLRQAKLGLSQIQKLVGLKELPHIIECYDISNIQGQYAVASGVMLKDGFPYKSGYRRYKIQTVEGPNDPAMMAEVIRRRLLRIQSGEITPPDLIVIDGGIPQLKAAMAIKSELNSQVPLVALAKKKEELYLEDGRLIQSDPQSPGMLILRLARDEAHRFGLVYHRNRRLKENLKTLFEDIPGIGEVREKKIVLFLRKISLDNYNEELLAHALQKEAQLPKELAQKVAKKVFIVAEKEGSA